MLFSPLSTCSIRSGRLSDTACARRICVVLVKPAFWATMSRAFPVSACFVCGGRLATTKLLDLRICRCFAFSASTAFSFSANASFSLTVNSLRCSFSAISSISISSASSAVMTVARISFAPIRSIAFKRRSPAISTYPPSDCSMTVIGLMSPCSWISFASSSSPPLSLRMRSATRTSLMCSIFVSIFFMRCFPLLLTPRPRDPIPAPAGSANSCAAACCTRSHTPRTS